MLPRPLFPMAALLLALALAGCTESSSQQPAQAQQQRPPTPVSIITVQPETVPVTNNLPGRIAPTRIAEVRPRVAGIVVERVFQQGSVVKQGDVLYRIDPATFRVRVASADATLKRAEAALLEARQQANRLQELRERAVASVQQLESATARLAQADADVAVAQAGVAAAQLDLEYSEVKAPITGRIGRALITEGALVGPTNAESLATIQQLDPVYADFTQSAAELLALRQALKAGVLTSADGDSADVRLFYDNGQEYPHRGKLLFSEATVDATTGQVTLRGEFPNPDGDLLPGMYVRVLIEQGLQPNAVAVPQQAVQRDAGGGSLVYVVNAEGVAELRQVIVGRPAGNRWVVDSGLKAGDQVIVEGFQKIGPGARVAPQPWQASAVPQATRD